MTTPGTGSGPAQPASAAQQVCLGKRALRPELPAQRRAQLEPAGPHVREQVHPHHRQRVGAPAAGLGVLLHRPARGGAAHACRPRLLLPPPHPGLPLPHPLWRHRRLLLRRHGAPCHLPAAPWLPALQVPSAQLPVGPAAMAARSSQACLPVTGRAAHEPRVQQAVQSTDLPAGAAHAGAGPRSLLPGGHCSQ